MYYIVAGFDKGERYDLMGGLVVMMGRGDGVYILLPTRYKILHRPPHPRKKTANSSKKSVDLLLSKSYHKYTILLS